MKIQILMENTAPSFLYAEHGLSLYVETDRHHLLVDTGKSGRFLDNAKKEQVAIHHVDTAVISHGHYDHGGGLQAFLKENQKAQVYLQRSAFGSYYSDHGESIDYIGLDPDLLKSSRLIFLEGNCRIDEQLFLFSGVGHDDLWPRSNRTLYEKKEEIYVQDEFIHEQNLLVTEGEIQVLFCGCAHNGIVNILKKSRELSGRWPDAVIGGFHLMNPSKKEEADEELVRKVAEFLKIPSTKKGPTRYYTGHCTGAPAISLLQELLRDRVETLCSGKQIKIF